MHRKAPLSAQIEAKVNDVVRLFREERNVHPKEHWREPCRRVAQETGVSVSLVCDLVPECVPRETAAHGNWHLETALAQCYVAVTEWPDWKLVFKLWDWTLPNGVQLKQANVEDEALSTPIAEAADAGGACVPEKPPASHAALGANGHDGRRDELAAPGSGAAPAPSRSHPVDRRKSPAGVAPPIFNEARLIQEFDRRERDRGPIFAGFIVNDLLPRMGFTSTVAKRILRAMEAQDIVRTEQKRNPNQPERTTSFVTLNRRHPHVLRVLQGAAGVERTFPIGTIDGEPLSDRIIRERR